MKFLLLFFLSIVALAISQRAEDICRMPHSANTYDAGHCSTGGQPLWSYDASVNSCVKFYYFGCEGNDNRFLTKTQCELLCKKSEGFSFRHLT
uniref:BPTI/Kunitz inhibitor domain-containing protein n=1 Tax=Glossina palpalis gambiensis TaxID=67801 RepID=A0A1B0AZ74_9MUSC